MFTLAVSVSSDGLRKQGEKLLHTSNSASEFKKDPFHPAETVCLSSLLFSIIFLNCCRVGNVLLLFWKLIKILWVEAENTRQQSLDAEMLHGQMFDDCLYYFCFWWLYSTQICTRKEGEKLTRVVLCRLGLKGPTEDALSYLFICCFLLKGK